MEICVSEPYVIFSGGTPADPRLSTVPSLTVMKGNNMTVLEMEHEVVDFVTLSSTPWNSGMSFVIILSLTSLSTGSILTALITSSTASR